jgi:hypothetical protein
MASSQTEIESISKQKMDHKFTEKGMQDRLLLCKRTRIKCSPTRIVVHKRERAFRYEDSLGETVAIIYFYPGPDGVERRSIRLMVVDNTTFIQEVLPLPG